ncbi:MAG TPA: hypothetical protein VGD43_05520, partial [Micromonospora sp.]
GVNYTPETLASILSGLVQRVGDAVGKLPQQVSPRQSQPAHGLSRLTDRDALSRCLDAVAQTHDRGSVTVDLVDYASFKGEPALVLTFADSTGQRWAWAVGAECGAPGFGADDRYRLRVG